MDLVLEVADTFVFDKLYANLFPRDLPFGLNGYLTNINSFIGNATSHMESNEILADKLSFITNLKQSISNGHVYGANAPTYWFPETCDTYASILGRSNIIRQTLSMFAVMSVFGWVLYFCTALLAYLFVFDKAIFNHPRYLKNQMSLEIKQASSAIPVMVLLTIPWFLLELHGYSKLYYNIDESTGGWKAIFWQVPSFIMFTDCGIYFIHRWLHWPAVYKKLHKPHHKWIVCTPFASHAFHPVDGYCQSLPYHWFPFVLPLHKVSYLILFAFVNFWTVMIHDGEYLSNDPFVNGTACHTIHHLYFNYNYGQFTTLWDRLGGSYRKPDDELFDKKKRNETKTWKKQVTQMEPIRNELEGKDDYRVYGTEERMKKQQ